MGQKWIVAVVIGWGLLAGSNALAGALEVEGSAVTPHVQSMEMRYGREPDRSLGARVQLFLRNTGSDTLILGEKTTLRMRERTPDQLIAIDEWAWHDFPSAWTNQEIHLAPGALTVWSFNGKRETWGTGTSAPLKIETGSGITLLDTELRFEQPRLWLSTVTFLGEETNPSPRTLIFHVANAGEETVTVEACRLWLPETNNTWRALKPGPWRSELERFPNSGEIAPGDRGGGEMTTGPLPLTYTALEVRLRTVKGEQLSLWAHLRIRREWFDISGGWVNSSIGGRSSLTFEPFLKTLKRMHINTAHMDHVGGYTDNAALYEAYPLKYFNRLSPADGFDSDRWLPRIHAVEFLGEPQYGGGRPVPPMEVWRALAPYQASRLATTVTHSEERIWRFYAGLSDFPHYDAYRVSAPAADAWGQYDRWGGERIRWGAPLETIGEMTRSLRDLNRPSAVAYWSQGAHDGWDVYGGRKRTSPTADELRVQAWQALAARITSLYWFNLSLNSLVKFPDLIEPMTQVGREIRMLDHYFLEGDGYWHRRVDAENGPAWDTSTVAGPRGGICVVTDLTYVADRAQRVFSFSAPRVAELEFALPGYLRNPAQVLQVDADGVSPVGFTPTAKGFRVSTTCGPITVFFVAPRTGAQALLEARRRALLKMEADLGFNPGSDEAHLTVLRDLAGRKRR